MNSVQRMSLSAVQYPNAIQSARDVDIRQQHNISGIFVKLTFSSEQRAKKGLQLLLGDERTTGTVQMFGGSVEVQLCVCEVDPKNRNEKCLCSAKKLQADLETLEGAFEGLAVENRDTVMKEGAPNEELEPDKKLDGIVEAMEKWGRPSSSEEVDYEML